MPEGDSLELYRRVQEKDSDAACELFNRYVERLMALVRVRLSSKLARRIDPEDVIQSAYRSFFAGTADGRFEVTQSGDLWKLLAAVTVNKLHRQIGHHQAGRRTVTAEKSTSLPGLYFQPLPLESLAKDPSPEEALILIEELQFVMSELKAEQREMLEMRLQGSKVSEIANQRNCSERTVRRFLEKVKNRLQQRLLDFSN